MSGRPQQPELNRSGRTDLEPDHAETAIEATGERAPRDEEAPGPVPEDNRPGHHPDHDQDQPDLDAVAGRLGTKPTAERAVQLGRLAGQAVAFPLRATARVLERVADVVGRADGGEGESSATKGSGRRRQRSAGGRR